MRCGTNVARQEDARLLDTHRAVMYTYAYCCPRLTHMRPRAQRSLVGLPPVVRFPHKGRNARELNSAPRVATSYRGKFDTTSLPIWRFLSLTAFLHPSIAPGTGLTFP